jgi:hypothetical protein
MNAIKSDSNTTNVNNQIIVIINVGIRIKNLNINSKVSPKNKIDWLNKMSDIIRVFFKLFP